MLFARTTATEWGNSIMTPQQNTQWVPQRQKDLPIFTTMTCLSFRGEAKINHFPLQRSDGHFCYARVKHVKPTSQSGNTYTVSVKREDALQAQLLAPGQPFLHPWRSSPCAGSVTLLSHSLSTYLPRPPGLPVAECEWIEEWMNMILLLCLHICCFSGFRSNRVEDCRAIGNKWNGLGY